MAALFLILSVIILAFHSSEGIREWEDIYDNLRLSFASSNVLIAKSPALDILEASELPDAPISASEGSGSNNGTNTEIVKTSQMEENTTTVVTTSSTESTSSNTTTENTETTATAAAEEDTEDPLGDPPGDPSSVTQEPQNPLPTEETKKETTQESESTTPTALATTEEQNPSTDSPAPSPTTSTELSTEASTTILSTTATFPPTTETSTMPTTTNSSVTHTVPILELPTTPVALGYVKGSAVACSSLTPQSESQCGEICSVLRSGVDKAKKIKEEKEDNTWIYVLGVVVGLFFLMFIALLTVFYLKRKKWTKKAKKGMMKQELGKKTKKHRKHGNQLKPKTSTGTTTTDSSDTFAAQPLDPYLMALQTKILADEKKSAARATKSTSKEQHKSAKQRSSQSERLKKKKEEPIPPVPEYITIEKVRVVPADSEILKNLV